MSNILKLNGNSWFDNVRTYSLRNKATNFVSNRFKFVSNRYKSVSERLSSVNQKYRAIRFIATLALSTWLISADVRTFASNRFKSISQSLSSINQKNKAITFLATLALSTWLTSAIVGTGVDFLSNSINPFEVHCSNPSRSLFPLFNNCQKVTPGPLFNWNWAILSKEQFLANGLYPENFTNR